MKINRKAPAIILIAVGIVAIVHSYFSDEFTNIVSIIVGAIVLAIGMFSLLSDYTLAEEKKHNKSLAVILIFVGFVSIIFNYILVTIPVNFVSMFGAATMIGIGIVYLILAIRSPNSNSDTQEEPCPSAPDSIKDIPDVVKNLVQFCWGMTLNLSHESTQSMLGSKLLDTVLPEIKVDSKLKEKSLGLYMILSRTMRNIAFTRDAHVRHLDDQARRYTQTRDLFESIGEISFSKESIFYKVISFLFFGAGLQYIFVSAPNKGQEIPTNENAFSVISGILNMTVPEANKIPLIKDVIGLQQNLQQQAVGINDILLFVFFGILGVIAVTVGFRIITHFYLSGWKENKIKAKQNEYWVNNYIKDMANILCCLYKDITRLLYSEEKSLVRDNDVREWIKNEILPIAKIDWTIWIGQNKKASSEEK